MTLVGVGLSTGDAIAAGALTMELSIDGSFACGLFDRSLIGVFCIWELAIIDWMS